jgi:hypothetical protein
LVHLDVKIFLPIVLMNDNASIPHDPEVSIADLRT